MPTFTVKYLQNEAIFDEYTVKASCEHDANMLAAERFEAEYPTEDQELFDVEITRGY